MEVFLASTQDFTPNYFRCLLYGRTGIGKTTLLGTAPKPFIIATEDGLEPLSNLDLKYRRIYNSEDLRQLWTALQASTCKTVCIDSLTALSDMLLAEIEQETGSDEAMKTYPILRSKLLKIINGFLQMKKHIIMTATETRSDDKPVLPSVIGSKLCEDLGRLFDHVHFMDFSSRSSEGTSDQVVIHRSRHRFSLAKDRSGELGTGVGKYCAGYFDDVIGQIFGKSSDTLPPAVKNPPNPKTEPKPKPKPKKETKPKAQEEDGAMPEDEIPFPI